MLGQCWRKLRRSGVVLRGVEGIVVSSFIRAGTLSPPLGLRRPTFLDAPLYIIISTRPLTLLSSPSMNSSTVRKSIARVLTVINQKTRAELRVKTAGDKYKPLDLRVKKTRAIRRRLTKVRFDFGISTIEFWRLTDIARLSSFAARAHVHHRACLKEADSFPQAKLPRQGLNLCYNIGRPRALVAAKGRRMEGAQMECSSLQRDEPVQDLVLIRPGLPCACAPRASLTQNVVESKIYLRPFIPNTSFMQLDGRPPE